LLTFKLEDLHLHTILVDWGDDWAALRAVWNINSEKKYHLRFNDFVARNIDLFMRNLL